MKAVIVQRTIHPANLGGGWINKGKRLAIYLRDGLACVYCGAGVEDGTKLTLDHLRPFSSAGTANPTNLVTCCVKCNCSRGKRSWKAFATSVAAYLNHGVTANALINQIDHCRSRKLDTRTAREILKRRGTILRSLDELRQKESL